MSKIKYVALNRAAGVPDEILKCDSGHTILDYKTARFTETQDALMPVYEAQLNGYAVIAEALGMSVIGLGLVYYEPVAEISDIDTVIVSDGFRMGFTAHILPIERNPELIPALLAKAQAVTDMPEPPESAVGCRDCLAVERLVGFSGQRMAEAA